MILIYVQNYDILEFVNRYPNGIHYLKLKSELQKDESPENCFEDFFAFLGTKLDGSTWCNYDSTMSLAMSTVSFSKA